MLRAWGVWDEPFKSRLLFFPEGYWEVRFEGWNQAVLGGQVEGGSYFLRDTVESPAPTLVPSDRPLVVSGKRFRPILPYYWKLQGQWGVISTIAQPSYSLTDGVDNQNPGIWDWMFGFRGYLGWEHAERLTVEFGVGTQLIPEEHYQYGMVALQVEYRPDVFLWYQKWFHKEVPSEELTSENLTHKPEDPSILYYKERSQKLAELDELYRHMGSQEFFLDKKKKLSALFPRFHFRYSIELGFHSVGAHRYTRTDYLTPLENFFMLSQQVHGPDILFFLNPEWAFLGGVRFYSYGKSVETLCSVLEVGNPIQTVGLLPLEFQFLSLKNLDLFLSSSWNLNLKHHLVFRVHYENYSFSTPVSVFRVVAMDEIALNPSFQLSFGLTSLWNLTQSIELMNGNFLNVLGTINFLFKI